jgi:hypothetical protein
MLSKPNGALFTPAWSASEVRSARLTAKGHVVAPNKAGTYQIVLIVSDGVVRAGQQVALDVVEAP